MKRAYVRTAVWLWREWLRPLALAVAVVLPLKSAVADWNYVPSGSMMPSIVPLELVWVNKLAYDLKVPFTTRHIARWGDPQRGEVVVFYSPADEARLVKRVVGLPGDVVEMRSETLWLNGVPVAYTVLPEAASGALAADLRDAAVFAEERLGERAHPVMVQPRRAALRSFGPVTIPAGHYFMLGDNRDDSHDSRFYGGVPRERIVGRATTVIASVDPDRWGWPRFERFFRSVP
jgi:signal peptidase I